MKTTAGASTTVLVTIRFFDEASVARLEARGHRVIRADIAYDELDTEITPGIERALASAHAWILGTAPVKRELLERFPQLQIIARRGVGYDNIDVEAVKSLGRLLTNTPGGGEPAVADHAMALMLAVAKRVTESHQRMQRGDWSAVVGTEMYGKMVGLLGFGRIGRMVAKRLQGFDTRILVCDPYLDQDTAQAAGVTVCGLEDLLRQSDFLSLHAPLTKDTRGMINAQSIASMKREAILVNTSRGELIDEPALLNALQSGQLAGAGLDVFLGEKDHAARAVAERLLALPNVVGTPHTAASTRDSLTRANFAAADCVAAALEGTTVPTHCVVADGRIQEAA
jgi:D-3-phosphoglycerate dehydrogenase / 2-oxoglutarate reductase